MEGSTLSRKELERLNESLSEARKVLLENLETLNMIWLKLRDEAEERQCGFNFAHSRNSGFKGIVRILEARNDWMAPREIRSAYRSFTGERIADSTLRYYLRKNQVKDDSHGLFQRDGRGRSTRWRLFQTVFDGKEAVCETTEDT